MFAENRNQALAQAKEQSGNLTGSGFANALGTTTNRSLVEEDMLLAQMLQAERQMMMQGLVPFATAGVGGNYTGYQPGFLDYLMQGASKAAPAFAPGGAFGS